MFQIDKTDQDHTVWPTILKRLFTDTIVGDWFVLNKFFFDIFRDLF